ncbi:MAG: hypothetical protein JNM74_18090 [Myxococcales bacterium]|nr:hypothetical protein [Myxococcales bacterium]
MAYRGSIVRLAGILSFASFASFALAACGSDDGTSGTSPTPSSTASAAGTCTGAFRQCTFGSLGRDELDQLCDTALTVSGAKPGTKTTCSDGTEITITDKAACVSAYQQNQKCASLAALSGGQVLDCVAEGLRSPCAVLEGQACAPVKAAIAKCQ